MTSDPIGAMLTTLRNGTLRRATHVSIPKSKLSAAILVVLKDAGYIFEIEELKPKDKQGLLKVGLLSGTRKPVFREIKRLSRPGLRRYAKATQIPTPLGGYGLIVISTPKGVMTGETARARGLGGELLCEVS